MKFVDEAIIKVKAGDGGSGCKSFRREKFIPYGGPDGGNGGNGGSVILLADRNKGTLLDFQFQPHWQAEDGKKGGQKKSEGKSGEDLTIRVPVGTQVFKADPASKERLGEHPVCDLDEDGQTFVLAKGGRGGKGNDFFKSATNRAPEHFQPGESGEEGAFFLSLKLVASVGLIGFPNAGKSTLISRISAARPKIADYPFTTLTPNLGVAQAKGGRSFVVADIPGLIPDAHKGKGLGVKFLKHVERTKVLAHLIDPGALDESGEPVPVETACEQINNELKMFSPALAKKPQVIVLTKLDCVQDKAGLQEKAKLLSTPQTTCIAISSATGEGVEELLNLLANMLSEPESR